VGEPILSRPVGWRRSAVSTGAARNPSPFFNERGPRGRGEASHLDKRWCTAAGSAALRYPSPWRLLGGGAASAVAHSQPLGIRQQRSACTIHLHPSRHLRRQAKRRSTLPHLAQAPRAARYGGSGPGWVERAAIPLQCRVRLLSPAAAWPAGARGSCLATDMSLDSSACEPASACVMIPML
jgi:hypothetical protein